MYLLRALITVGAVWYLVEKVPLDEVGHALTTASASLVIAGLLTQVSLRVINAFRIRLIARAQGAPLSYGAILSTLFTTAFYGMMLPGSIGAGAATLVKYVGHGATLAAALVSMVVNRALETGTTIALGLFFWGLDRQLSGESLTGSALTAISLAAPFGLLAFYLMLFGRIQLMQRTALLLRRPPNASAGLLGRGFAGLLEQFAAAGRLGPGDAVAVAVLSVVKELLGAVAVWCFARACGVELSFITVAWMQAAVALLILLPLSLSGIGVRESALVLMSARFGVAAPLALTWSLLIFAGVVVIAAMGGLIEARALWLRDARSRGTA